MLLTTIRVCTGTDFVEATSITDLARASRTDILSGKVLMLWLFEMRSHRSRYHGKWSLKLVF